MEGNDSRIDTKTFLGTYTNKASRHAKKVGQTVAGVKVVSDRKTMIGISLEGFFAMCYKILKIMI